MKIIRENQLAYYEKAATPEFWNDRWKDLQNNPELYLQFQLPSIIFDAVTSFVPKGGHILEAGCGMGSIVYALNKSGWKCTGVDFAQQTVDTIRIIKPELDVLTADVRQLPFPDETFDGYISISVIEHFIEGYSEILQEMDRVLQRSGTAIIAFPAMNQLRRIKKSLGLYPAAYTPRNGEALLKFYQFALDHKTVIKDLRELGYTIKTIQWYEAWLGFADESPGVLGRVFRSIYNKRNSKVCSAIRHSFESLSGLTGYSCQIVAQKNG